MCLAGWPSRPPTLADSAEQHILPPGVVHAGALQFVQSGRLWGMWVGRRMLRRGHPYLIWSLWECQLPVPNGPWRLRRSLCCPVICTGRGSEDRIQGDPGDLEMVSALGECGDGTRRGRTRCGGTRPPSCQLWKLRTSVPSCRNRRGWASCRDPRLRFSQIVR